MSDGLDRLPPLERFDLEGAFADQEKQLAATLARGRHITDQPGIVGDATEAGWKDMLGDFLPGRYRVDSGKVIDSQGHQSEQIDIIIHDNYYSPLMFSIGDARFVPVESVYAVLEVRQTLNKANLDYAAQKAESVRRLHRTSTLIPNQFGKAITKDLDRSPILAGILTSKSDWRPPFDNTLRSHLAGQPPQRTIDIGCALSAGAFDTQRRPLVTDRALLRITSSGPERALSYFVIRLLHRLQQLGTVGAIDYETYASHMIAG